MTISEVGAGTQRAGSSAVANPKTQALPANVTAGNLVVVASYTNRTTGVFVAGDCTKNAGSTATLGTIYLVKAAKHSAVDQVAGIWVAKVATGGSLTMAVAGDGSNFVSCVVNEYSSDVGFDDTSSATLLEASNSAEGTTATAINSGNATSAGKALFLGAVAVNNGALITLTLGSGWTNIFSSLNGTTEEVGQGATKIVSTGTTDSFNTTISVAPTQWVAVVAVIKEQASAGTAIMGRSIWMTA